MQLGLELGLVMCISPEFMTVAMYINAVDKLS